MTVLPGGEGKHVACAHVLTNFLCECDADSRTAAHVQ